MNPRRTHNLKKKSKNHLRISCWLIKNRTSHTEQYEPDTRVRVTWTVSAFYTRVVRQWAVRVRVTRGRGPSSSVAIAGRHAEGQPSQHRHGYGFTLNWIRGAFRPPTRPYDPQQLIEVSIDDQSMDTSAKVVFLEPPKLLATRGLQKYDERFHGSWVIPEGSTIDNIIIIIAARSLVCFSIHNYSYYQHATISYLRGFSRTKLNDTNFKKSRKIFGHYWTLNARQLSLLLSNS